MYNVYVTVITYDEIILMNTTIQDKITKFFSGKPLHKVEKKYHPHICRRGASRREVPGVRHRRTVPYNSGGE